MTTGPSPADAVRSGAFMIAREIGSSYLGVEHLLLAVAADSGSVAANVLSDMDVTPEKVSTLLAEQGQSISSSAGVSATPKVYSTLGVSRGLALADGVVEDSRHILLALTYTDSSRLSLLWRQLRVDPTEVRVRVSAATSLQLGADPRRPVQALSPRGGVQFPEAARPEVIAAMVAAFPPGSEVQWGWNMAPNDFCVIYTDRPTEVLSLVRSVVADAGSVSPCENDTFEA
jgi:ATP-dependent Clp protease ATP-binding subunit ClpA